MFDPRPFPDGDNTDGVPQRKPTTPIWKPIFLILVIILILGLAYLHVAGIVGPGAH